jgi:hypothetical protein
MRFRFSIFVALVLAYGIPVIALQRDKCAADIAQKLQNGSLKYDDSIFFRQGNVIMSNIANIELTVTGCEAQCGKNFDWYSDVGPRLTTWLIPVVLLIGNLCLATLGKPNSLLTIMHLLGDPIDSLWSLLTKLETWNRCWDLAEHLSSTGAMYKDHVRDRGTILAAIQELEGPGSDPSNTYQRIINNSTLDGNDPGRPRLHHLCREIANELSDSSSNELPRTCLAIMSYIFAILSAFVEAIGGKSSSQPGGRIGAAMFLSWLLPIVLLSNTVGSFTSRRTLVRILERFAKGTKPIVEPELQSNILGYSPSPPKASRSPSRHADTAKGFNQMDAIAFKPTHGLSPPFNPMFASNAGQDHKRRSSEAFRKPSAEYLDLQIFSQDRPSTLFGRPAGSLTSFDKAQPWFGGIYTYQSEKRLFTVPNLEKRSHRPLKLLCVSIFPMVIASVTAFLIIWFTPTTGLTCRHLPLFAITGLWFCSTFIGQMTWRSIATGRYHWWITLTKDAIIAIPSLLMIFLQSSGIFNSCYCWGSVYSRGALAYVQLEPDNDRKHNAETIYPALVWACLGLQALVFLVALRLSKRGRLMMRKDEETKMNDFWQVHRGTDARPEGERGTIMGEKNIVDVEMHSALHTPNAETTPFLKR